MTQLSSYLVNLKTTLFGSPYQSIFFSTKAPKSSKRKVKLSTDIVNNFKKNCASFKLAVVLFQAKQKVVMLRNSIWPGLTVKKVRKKHQKFHFFSPVWTAAMSTLVLVTHACEMFNPICDVHIYVYVTTFKMKKKS